LFAFTGDLAVAQDVVQEAFTRAVPRWKTLCRYDDPAAWVRRVAFNLARSRWRHARVALRFAQRQREEYVDGPGPDRVELMRALARLPERQRQAVVLHYLAGLSVAEIASHTGAVEGTVKSWLSRARAALATHLSDSEEVRRA
jgi:RNA polymerase sigma-70 factor, ECF subfamily